MSFSEPRLDYHTQDIRLLNSPSIPALLLTGLRRVRRVGLLGADPPALLVQSALHLRSGNVFVGANEIRWPPFYVCLFSCLGHLRVAPQRRHRDPDLARGCAAKLCAARDCAPTRKPSRPGELANCGACWQRAPTESDRPCRAKHFQCRTDRRRLAYLCSLFKCSHGAS
jgi:hypothetical protein